MKKSLLRKMRRICKERELCTLCEFYKKECNVINITKVEVPGDWNADDIDRVQRLIKKQNKKTIKEIKQKRNEK